MSDINSELTLDKTKDKQKDTVEVKTDIKTDIKAESTPACKPAETKKAAAITHKLYIQYNDLEFSDELMFEAAVNAYCNEFNKDKSFVETVNLYVKPQEGKAYYVINDDAKNSGSIDL